MREGLHRHTASTDTHLMRRTHTSMEMALGVADNAWSTATVSAAAFGATNLPVLLELK